MLHHHMSLVSTFRRHNWIFIGRCCWSVADVESAKVVLVVLRNAPANGNLSFGHRRHLNVGGNGQWSFCALLDSLQMEFLCWTLFVVVVGVHRRYPKLVMAMKFQIVNLVWPQMRWNVFVECRPILVLPMLLVVIVTSLILRWNRHILNFEELNWQQTVWRRWLHRPFHHHRLVVETGYVGPCYTWQNCCGRQRIKLEALRIRFRQWNGPPPIAHVLTSFIASPILRNTMTMLRSRRFVWNAERNWISSVNLLWIDLH